MRSWNWRKRTSVTFFARIWRNKKKRVSVTWYWFCMIDIVMVRKNSVNFITIVWKILRLPITTLLCLCLNYQFLFINNRIYLFFKNFMLGITMQLDISARLTPQLTTIICQHMKKLLLKKKIQKYGGIDQNPYVNKNHT